MNKRDERREKNRRKREKRFRRKQAEYVKSVTEGHPLEPGTWIYLPERLRKREPEIYIPAPGIDRMPQPKDFLNRCRQNVWHSPAELESVIKTIRELAQEDGDWTWAYNSGCKYVDLRFDMRDGAFVMMNATGRINEEMLRWQYKTRAEHANETNEKVETNEKSETAAGAGEREVQSGHPAVQSADAEDDGDDDALYQDDAGGPENVV